MEITTPCAQCGATIIAPEWSEHRSDRCVRNVWSCEVCGYQFENVVYFSAPQIQPEFTDEESEPLPGYGFAKGDY